MYAGEDRSGIILQVFPISVHGKPGFRIDWRAHQDPPRRVRTHVVPGHKVYPGLKEGDLVRILLRTDLVESLRVLTGRPDRFGEGLPPYAPDPAPDPPVWPRPGPYDP